MTVKEKHVSSEKFQCGKCHKTFVLKWRLSKHQEIHDNLSVKKCHYFNNKKFCPFEEIGCMFEHALSGNCKHEEKCTKSLCSFQHGEKCDSIGEEKETLETHISALHTDEGVLMTEDEQNFDLYVDNCFPEIYSKFIDGKGEIKCYFCNYVSNCKIMRNIQEELTNHLATNYTEIVDAYDPDNYDFDDDYHEEFLDFSVQ